MLTRRAFTQSFAASVFGASVRDFGAKGDGIADDTAAIERAVAESREGVLAFTRGAYRLTRTVEVKLATRGPLSLLGDGGGRLIMAGAGPAFRFIGTHTGAIRNSTFT